MRPADITAAAAPDDTALGRRLALAILFSLALHGAVMLSVGWLRTPPNTPVPSPPDQTVVLINLESPAEEPGPPPPTPAPLAPLSSPAPPVEPASEPEARPLAYQHAPATPSTEEWALASTYRLKNSKRYRYTWGVHVRSLMGTAVEGPDQGVVRFRVEIAPDGTLSRLETLWSTSPVAERLARQAIQSMPPLPPTPTGRPLVFERTISFQPFDAEVPPIYRNDCQPDPPGFRNPFAWNGTSEPVSAPADASAEEALSGEDLAACRDQLPQDTMEAEVADDTRQLLQWGSSRLARPCP